MDANRQPAPNPIEVATTAVENALDRLLEVVQDELAKAALEEGVTRMEFCLGSVFFRGRREVQSTRRSLHRAGDSGHGCVAECHVHKMRILCPNN